MYKTILLELIQQSPSLYQELRTSGTLLPTLERYVTMLRDLHLTWMETLNQQQPGRDPSQTSSEALELALQEIRDALPADSTPNAAEAEGPLSLDAAMAFIRPRTPPAS